jgi:peptide chain release factor 2
MRILLARLIDLDQQRQEEERVKLKGEHISAEFGRQVRSYVLHPYQMVKDHRTEHQESDAQAVLDGDFDPFLKAYLAAQVGEAPVAGQH